MLESLRNAFILLLPSRRKPRTGRRGVAPRARPRVEQLETRLAPAIITWGGGGVDNDWSTAANWVGGVAPGVNDQAVFNATSVKAAIHDANATGIVSAVSIQAGYTATLTLNTTLSATSSVTQAEPNSTIVIPANVALNTANMNFTAGTVSGTGTLTAANLTWGGVFNGGLTANAMQNLGITGDVTLDGATLNNSGAATWSGGIINLNHGAELHNQSGATFTDTAASQITAGTATDTFWNQGAFTVRIGAGQTTLIHSVFEHNMGANANVEVVSGKLSLQNGGPITARMTADAGTTIEFTWDGMFPLPAPAVLVQPIFLMGAGPWFGGLGQYLVDSGGRLGLLDNSNASFTATLVLDNGGLIQSLGPTLYNGTLSSSSMFNWQGGTIMGIVTSTGQMQITGANIKFLDNGRLNNLGSATWTGTGNIEMDDNAWLYNTATFDVQNNQTFTTDLAGGKAPRGTTRLVQNADDGQGHFGTFKKTVAGTTATSTVVQFQNQGLLDLSSVASTLFLQDGFTQGGANSKLKIGLFGGAAGQYSQVTVSGIANLGGNLQLAYGGTYTGKKGDSFEVIIATSFNGTSFAVPFILPPPPAGTIWNWSYNRAPASPENLTFSL